jgi:hypothetical protein
VQFLPLQGKFTVASMNDSGGLPVDVLDTDVAHQVTGTIDLPSWLVGDGVVTVYADELGGPFDGQIGTKTVKLTGSVSIHDPKLKTYDWQVDIAPNTLPDPSPGSGIYKMAVSFVFKSPPGGHTDIASFVELGTFQVV